MQVRVKEKIVKKWLWKQEKIHKRNFLRIGREVEVDQQYDQQFEKSRRINFKEGEKNKWKRKISSLKIQKLEENTVR